MSWPSDPESWDVDETMGAFRLALAGATAGVTLLVFLLEGGVGDLSSEAWELRGAPRRLAGDVRDGIHTASPGNPTESEITMVAIPTNQVGDYDDDSKLGGFNISDSDRFSRIIHSDKLQP